MRIDIVSDIVCPWCIVGYKQLEYALQQTGTTAEIHWQPFELNPEMSQEGENLTDHIIRKYGISRSQSLENRKNLTALGAELGFRFAFNEESRMLNTFKAHQLLHWAALNGREHQLKITLFHCYFNRDRDISDDEVLANAAVEAGLPYEEALDVLDSALYADAVRERERFSIGSGIQGVPAMIFDQRELHVGAQGIEGYVKILNALAAGQ
ncbi:disulfide bond formation protein DsbA [Chromatiales bacterium (ex Bugula neritina AB1)]|nr:disulfide bond formation protein DsbA [Chromatiales bacterium (ex Bugula neritina AB1)]